MYFFFVSTAQAHWYDEALIKLKRKKKKRKRGKAFFSPNVFKLNEIKKTIRTHIHKYVLSELTLFFVYDPVKHVRTE